MGCPGCDSAENVELVDFGSAIDALKDGRKITRKGWNGKNMYLYLVPAQNYAPTTEHAKKEFGDLVPYQSYIAMKNAQGFICMWSASNSDLLECDRLILN